LLDKSQLVGTWDYSVNGLSPAERWIFRDDNTCYWRHGTVSGADCTYAVLDDGTIKVKFKSGGTVEGKLNAGNLTMDGPIDRSILHKQ